MQKTLDFLKAIEKNNNREWFNENKVLYEQALSEFKTFTNKIYQILSTIDNVDPPKIFRIYRDVRFSKNKAPYKTNFGVSFNRTKPGKGSYYFHVQPHNSFGGGGFWQPEKKDLQRIRKELETCPSDIKKIIYQKNFKEEFEKIKGDELKTTPKGFEKDAEMIDLIRKKDFLLMKPFTDKMLVKNDINNTLKNMFKTMLPFLHYFTEILSTDLNGQPI